MGRHKKQPRSVTETRIAWGMAEIARICGVSLTYLRHEIKTGRLKAVRVSTRVLIRDAALKDWITRTAQ